VQRSSGARKGRSPRVRGYRQGEGAGKGVESATPHSS
jgi:hypothetical protein